MDFDLDDLISFDDANNVKASAKFKPKLKPKPKPKPITQPKQKPAPNPPTQVVKVPTIADNEIIRRTEEEQPGVDVNRISANINDDLQNSFDKLQQEHAEPFHTSDSPDNVFPESTTTAVNLPPYSETRTLPVSNDDTIKEGPIEPDLNNNIDASTNSDSLAEIDPLTGEEAAIYNDNGEIAHIWDHNTLPHSQTSAGQRFGKYKPKPRAQTRKLEHISTDTAPTESVSEYTLNVEPIYLAEISQMVFRNEGDGSSEKIESRSNKTFELIDEAENEGYVDDTIHRNENNNDNDRDGGPESQSLKEKKGSQRKKSLAKTKKPARKRKKAVDVGSSESMEVVKKKFTHRTKRTKRQVNQELLKIPEDELELQMHNLPIRDIIRLREHKERLEKKEASTSGTTAVNQSSSNPFDDDEAYAHGEGSADEHDYSAGAQNATYYNYGTHLKKRQTMKWTKQDTELFYEAIQQFGSDLSMIKECFPGRTRAQIKSKYKKEERTQPLRLHDALTTRAEGTTHFEDMIERIKQAQAEEYAEDDPMSLLGEDDEGLPTHDINESVDATKPEQLEVKEPDVPAVESPTKSHDSEDEMYLWSQYKSEI